MIIALPTDAKSTTDAQFHPNLKEKSLGLRLIDKIGTDEVGFHVFLANLLSDLMDFTNEGCDLVKDIPQGPDGLKTYLEATKGELADAIRDVYFLYRVIYAYAQQEIPENLTDALIKVGYPLQRTIQTLQSTESHPLVKGAIDRLEIPSLLGTHLHQYSRPEGRFSTGLETNNIRLQLDCFEAVFSLTEMTNYIASLTIDHNDLRELYLRLSSAQYREKASLKLKQDFCILLLNSTEEGRSYTDRLSTIANKMIDRSSYWDISTRDRDHSLEPGFTKVRKRNRRIAEIFLLLKNLYICELEI